jgi:hypothetical protein
MSPLQTAAKVRKLEAVTVARGASPAEAATAASLARRLILQLAHRNDPDVRACAARRSGLAPGVHVTILSGHRLRTADCRSA